MLARILGLIAVVILAGWGAPVRAERVALVVGNAAYGAGQELRNPRNDAEALSAVLTDLGYTVLTGIDLSRNAFEERIQDFARAARGADAAIFFYAGHGIQVGDTNYLLPIDAEIEDETDLEFETIRLSTVIGLMEREQRTNLVFLDACRDNPMARSLARSMGTRSVSVGRGLAPVDTGLGTFIAFATQPNFVAYDGEGRNSPFTEALLQHIETPNLDVELMMRRVRVDVLEATGERQVPWTRSSLTGEFVFNRIAAAPATEVSAAGPAIVADPSVPPSQASADDAAAAGPSIGPSAGPSTNPSTGDVAREADRDAVQVAAVDPGDTAVEDVSEPPRRSERELALSVQQELNRLGCDAGVEDGIWGRKSGAALERLAEHAATIEVAALEPTEALLQRMEELDGRICPLVCAATEDLINDACVRKTCPGGQRLSSKGVCYTPRAAAPSRSRPSSGSKCFSFSGQTYCE